MAWRFHGSSQSKPDRLAIRAFSEPKSFFSVWCIKGETLGHICKRGFASIPPRKLGAAPSQAARPGPFHSPSWRKKRRMWRTPNPCKDSGGRMVGGVALTFTYPKCWIAAPEGLWGPKYLARGTQPRHVRGCAGSGLEATRRNSV